MSDTSEGGVLIQVRLDAAERERLEALQRVLERDSKANIGRIALKEWMRRQLDDPDIAAEVEAILSNGRVRT